MMTPPGADLRRLLEAARLGFTLAIVPGQGSEDLRPVAGIDVLTVTNLSNALAAALP